MSRKAKVPKAKTEGQLHMIGLTGSESELAAKIGCGPAVIGHWRRGRRVPGEAHRHKLELLFGIPQRAWDVEPGTALTPSSLVKPVPLAPEDEDDTLTITKGQIDAVLVSLTDDALTDMASSRLRDTLAKLLALRSRLERDRDLLEDRVVRGHPEWERIKSAILKALKAHPDAMAAVIEVLR